MTTQQARHAGVNTTLQGRMYGPVRYEVSAARIEDFAEATGAYSSLHTDRDAARQAGYRDIVASPTFAVVVAQAAEALYVSDPESGIDFTRVVHADESFTHQRPIVAGDVLHTSVEVTSIVERGPLTLITTTATIRDDADRVVSVVSSTLAVRGE